MCWLVVIFLSLLIEPVWADDVTNPDFSAYPNTDAFKSFVSNQTNSVWHLQRSNILSICAFYESDNVALQYWITEDGYAFNVRTVYDWAHQDSQRQHHFGWGIG